MGLLENITTKKGKQLVYFDYQNVNSPCSHYQLVLFLWFYQVLYNNQVNVRALIGQSAMVYCASKLMEKSCVF